MTLKRNLNFKGVMALVNFVGVITLFFLVLSRFAWSFDLKLVTKEVPDSLKTTRLTPMKMTIFWATSGCVLFYAYGVFQEKWGKSEGKFHFKWEDWSNDGLLFTDEVSHMFASYKLFQLADDYARWTGFSPFASRTVAWIVSCAVMIFVEFPMDAYNPCQGVGFSDIGANLAGIAFASARDKYNWLRKFDLKCSVKNTKLVEPFFLATSLASNDNYIYWLTYNPDPSKYPFHIGIGYSASHWDVYNPRIKYGKKEVYIGFGISASDFAGMDKFYETNVLGINIGRFLDFCGFYSFNFRILVWSSTIEVPHEYIPY